MSSLIKAFNTVIKFIVTNKIREIQTLVDFFRIPKGTRTMLRRLKHTSMAVPARLFAHLPDGCVGV